MVSSRWLAALIIAGAGCAGALPLQAAQPLPAGWYIQGGAGINWPRDTDVEVGGFEREVQHDLGWIGAGSVGYAWQNGFRLELEGAYRWNDVDDISGGGGTGDISNISIIPNLIYEYRTTGWVIPYVGLGVGAGRVKYDGVSPAGAPPTTTVDDSGWSPAFQALVGVEFPVMTNLGLNVGYRFLYEPWVDMTAANGASVDTNYMSHALLVGLRWSFGAPPAPMMAEAPRPAPAPAPPPPPAMQQAPSQYLVFFDWSSAALTAEAQRIIRTAADAAKQGRVARIEVTGHADRSGPEDYNMRLSQRRADAVKAELVRNGVGANDISTFAKGETDPLVPTADGVREPQNRRVQIVFPQARPGA